MRRGVERTALVAKVEGVGDCRGHLPHSGGDHPGASLALAASFAALVRAAGPRGAFRFVESGVGLEPLEEDTILASDLEKVGHTTRIM